MKTGRQRKAKRKPSLFSLIHQKCLSNLIKTQHKQFKKLLGFKSKHTKRKIKRGWISQRKDEGVRVLWNTRARVSRGEWDGKGKAG